MQLLETPLLRIPTNKQTFARWANLLGNVRENDVILSCAIPNKLYCPAGVELHSWDFLGSRTTLDFPSSFYDVVYLNHVLEHHGEEDRRKLVREGLRCLKPGGQMFACSIACNDQEEVYRFADQHGYGVDRFLATRLNNRDIASLRPTDAAFFKSMVVVPDRKRFVSYLHEQGFSSAKLEDMWSVKGTFPVSRLSVGMRWVKPL